MGGSREVKGVSRNRQDSLGFELDATRGVYDIALLPEEDATDEQFGVELATEAI